MSISKDIIETEVRFTSNEAMANLTKLESETGGLRRENERLAVTKAKLKSLGKEETEEYKKISAAMAVNSKRIKGNESSMASMRRVIGVTAMSMKDLRKRASELRGQLDSTSKAANPKEYARLEKELGQVHHQMNNLGAGTNRTGRILGGLKALMPALGIAAVAAALKSVITSIIQVRSEFERYHAVLKNTLGSAQAARMEMSMLKEFASSTPFELNQLTGAFVKLVNQGFKPNREEMRKLGDLASSTGKDFDMLAEAIIDAQVGEFERLKEFGIRAEKHGDQVKMTFKGVSTEVDFTAKSIQKYILGLGNIEGVSGSMNEIMGTLGGQVSNLKDTWTNFLNVLGGKSSGIFTTVIKFLSSFVTWVMEATYSVKQIKEMVLDDITKQNLQSSIEEINTMATSLMRNGIKQKEAYDRALKLYNQSRDQQIASLKQQIDEATGVEKSGLEKRLMVLEAERNAVKDHYIELKKLESGKGAGKTDGKSLQEALEEQHDRRMLVIETQYAREEISKELHDNNMLVEELAYIQAQIQLKKRLGESTVQLELQLQEKISSIKEQAHKNEEDLLKSIYDLAADIEKQSEKLIDNLFKEFTSKDDAEIESQKRVAEALQKMREEQAKAAMESDKKLKEQRLQSVEQWANAATSAIETVQMFQQAAMNKELAAAGDNAKKREEIERKYHKKQQGWAIAQAVIEGAIEVARINSNAGVNADLSQTLRIVLTALAVARTAGQVALISSQKYDVGGYTPRGAWDQPQGVVHSDEFVANRHAVRNPQVRPILDVINLAQRSGQIGSLNTDTILRAVEARRGGYAGGGYSTPQPASPDSMITTDPELKAIIAGNAMVMEMLVKEIRAGIPATVSYQDTRRKFDEMDIIKRQVTIKA